MSFNVKRSEVDEVGLWIATYASQVGEQLALVSSAAQDLATLESFQGSAADSIKAYWGEMHVSASVALSVALSEIAMRYAAYMDGYGLIDDARDARFEESALTLAYTHFSSSRSDLIQKASSLHSATSAVSDIIGEWTPSISSLEDTLFDLADKARDIRIKVDAHETTHLAQSHACEALIDASRLLVQSLGSGGGALSYVPGSINSMPWSLALSSAFASSVSYQEGAASAYQTSIESLQGRMQERFDDEVDRLAQEREDQGFVQGAIAVITVAFGALIVFVSAGTATPIVAGLFVVAGVFQTSNLIEGAQNYYYGGKGDITSVAVNPLRDTVFLGNQNVYGAAEFIVTAAAGAAIPVASAVGIARATGSSLTKAATQGAKTLSIEFTKDQSMDIGLTIAIDPLIRKTMGDGPEGKIATEFVHQGVGLVGMGGGMGHKSANSSFRQLKTKIHNVELPKEIWSELPLNRGKMIDKFMGDNLGGNYPGIDKINEFGLVSSVKSRDLSAAGYQDGVELERTIKQDIDSLKEYSGSDSAGNGINIAPGDITGKQLQLVVPDAQLSLQQIEAMNSAIAYGKQHDIEVVVVVGH